MRERERDRVHMDKMISEKYWFSEWKKNTLIFFNRENVHGQFRHEFAAIPTATVFHSVGFFGRRICAHPDRFMHHERWFIGKICDLQGFVSLRKVLSISSVSMQPVYKYRAYFSRSSVESFVYLFNAVVWRLPNRWIVLIITLSKAMHSKCIRHDWNYNNLHLNVDILLWIWAIALAIVGTKDLYELQNDYGIWERNKRMWKTITAQANFWNTWCVERMLRDALSPTFRQHLLIVLMPIALYRDVART